MLLLPARHGKSELASKCYPAWLLGRNPERQFISVSATAELAADFGRDVRNIISSPEYRALFDTRLAEDNLLTAAPTKRLHHLLGPSLIMGVKEWSPGENKPDGLAFIVSLWPWKIQEAFAGQNPLIWVEQIGK